MLPSTGTHTCVCGAGGGKACNGSLHFSNETIQPVGWGIKTEKSSVGYIE